MNAELKRICKEKYNALQKALIHETDAAKKEQIKAQIKELEQHYHSLILKQTIGKNRTRRVRRKTPIRNSFSKKFWLVYNTFSWKIVAISFSFIIFTLGMLYLSIPFLKNTEQAKVTNLIQAPCPFGQILQNNICIGEIKKLTWDEANKEAQDFSFYNYNDWRMPTRVELENIGLYNIKETWLYNINQNDVTKASLLENNIIKEDDTSHLHPVVFVRTLQ